MTATYSTTFQLSSASMSSAVSRRQLKLLKPDRKYCMSPGFFSP